MPTHVSATAVTETGDVTHEDLIRAERVSVGAAARGTGDPLAVRGLHKVTDHDYNRMSADRRVATIASLARSRRRELRELVGRRSRIAGSLI